MTCLHHANLCAYPEPSPERCEYCHASWAKITAPAHLTTYRQGMTRARPGSPSVPITVEEVAYLGGYGETPLNHLWGHAADDARAKADAARRAAWTRKRPA